MRDSFAFCLFSINRQDACAAFSRTGPVVFKVEHDRVLTFTERWPRPPESFQIEHIVNENRLSLPYLRYAGYQSCNQPKRSEEQHCIARPCLPA
jgi:hypothetical protein